MSLGNAFMMKTMEMWHGSHWMWRLRGKGFQSSRGHGLGELNTSDGVLFIVIGEED